MDDSSYRLRPLHDVDLEAVSRLWTRVLPDLPASVDEVRHQFHLLEVGGIFRQFLVAELKTSGEIVATGLVFNPPWAFEPDRYWIQVAVDPAHEGRGLGRTLYRASEEVAQSRRAKILAGAVRADQPRSVRFFEQTGFVEQRRTWNSRLDLRESRPGSERGLRGERTLEGVEFTSVAEEGPERIEVRERLYRLDAEAGKDEPHMGPPMQQTLEQYVELVFRGPGYFPEGILLARVGEEYVAYTYLIKKPSVPDTLDVGFTGTLPAYRGRGIASELKRRAVDLARSRGYRYLRTNNDSVNKSIWAINEKLGFWADHVWIHGEKQMG